MTIGQILIGKDATYLAKRGGGSIATLAEITDLANGAIAIIAHNPDGGTIVSTAADLTGALYYKIAVGGVTAADTIMSKKINRNFVYTNSAYVAPVNKILYLGDDNTDTYDINLPATLVAGTVATMTLIDTANDTIPHKHINRYDYRVKTGDAKEDVINALVALAADSPLATVTAIGAATANAGIKFVAASGIDLKVAASGILLDAPVTGITPGKPGVGTPALLAEMESYYSVYQGNTARLNMNGLMYSKESLVDSTLTYYTFVLEWEYVKETVLNTVTGTKQHLVVAVPSGAADVIANLLALLPDMQTPDATLLLADRVTTLETP